MDVDDRMKEIIEVFFQESRERLDDMEAVLLSLDGVSDNAAIDTVFRAVHSIKGGAATFGFGDVSTFAHGVESLLDDMRTGRALATAEVVQILLQCRDCLRDMLKAAQAGKRADRGRIESLDLAVMQVSRRPLQPTDPSPAADASPCAAGTDTTLPAGGWHIRFEPVTDLLRLRNEPTRMFAELAALGAIAVRADLARLPDLGSMDPEACYLSWDIELTGDIARAQLTEVFDWVDPGCRLDIAPLRQVAAVGSDSAPAPAPPPGARVAAAASAPLAAHRPSSSAPLEPKSAGESASIRVATEKLDGIINLVGELLITQSMLAGFADGVEPAQFDALRKALAQLSRNTRALQESVMQVRMLPISFAFNRFPRLVHDLSRKLGKTVQIKLTGENTELDKTVLEKISDPLVHLVRNSLDHGLETPEVRESCGKSPQGTIELAAFHEGSSIVIEVKDDGAGLDRPRILAKARERGLIGPDRHPDDEEIDDLIFMPGFSTAERVSDISGRGVGMDVVRRNIEDLGGHVHVLSRAGLGSTVRVRLPLTLAILDGQTVRVGGETYVIPLLAIVETIQVSRHRFSSVLNGAEVFSLRGEYLPVMKLFELFAIEPDSRDAADGLLVVVEVDNRRACLLVDDLLAQQQVVIKSLECNYKSVPGIAGASIMGDGAVALIIDVRGLFLAADERANGVHAVRAA